MINTHKALDKHGNFYILGYEDAYFILEKYNNKEEYKVQAPVYSKKYTLLEHAQEALLMELEV